jgi:hypothetical protein
VFSATAGALLTILQAKADFRTHWDAFKAIQKTV